MKIDRAMKTVISAWRSKCLVMPGIVAVILASAAPAGAAPSSLDAQCFTPARRQYMAGIFGGAVGASGISVVDLDRDGTLEMLMGGNSAASLTVDDFWFVMKPSGAVRYQQVWASVPYGAERGTIRSIAAGNGYGNGSVQIYVGTSDGMVDVFDGTTHDKLASFLTPGTYGLMVADCDGDGSMELIMSDLSHMYVYAAAPPFTAKWSMSGWYSVPSAVGNVDGDPEPEIVAYGGVVLDGVTGAIEGRLSGDLSEIRIADLDGDGVEEICGASLRSVTCFSPAGTMPSWQVPYSNEVVDLALVDIGGDGIPEVLVGEREYNNPNVHVLDGLTGNELWAVRGYEDPTSITGGDLDGDGNVEIVWGSSDGAIHIADSAAQTVEWRDSHSDGPLAAFDYGDVDGDGSIEIALASPTLPGGFDCCSVLQIVDAKTHILKWQSEIDSANLYSVAAVRITDVDHDGKPELLVASSYGGNGGGLVVVYDGASGQLLRKTPRYNDAAFSALAVGDIDGDGSLEMVASATMSYGSSPALDFVVFDGATAVEKWRSEDASVRRPAYDLKLADVDADGTKEILITKSPYSLYVFDSVTHLLKKSVSTMGKPVAAADIDGDGQVEVLLGGPGGSVEIRDGASLALKSTWSLPMGDILSLVVDDVEGDGSLDCLVTDTRELDVYGGVGGPLKMRERLGTNVGLANQTVVADADQDGTREILVGSQNAIYKLIPQAGPPSRAPRPVPGGPYLARTGRTVMFDASGSSDPDGDPLVYSWDFTQDGTVDAIDTVPIARNVYLQTGNYDVGLLVTDATGACAEASTRVEVVVNRPPVAEAGGPYRGLVGLPIRFDASGSRDPDGAPLSFEWDFTFDGTADSKGVAPTIERAFAARGRYLVDLKVIDDVKASSTDRAEVLVRNANVALVAPWGGAVVHSGSRLAIRWQTRGYPDTVTLKYKIAGSRGWHTIATGVPASPASFEWTAPVVTIPRSAQIKVIAFRGRHSIGSDTHNQPLTVFP